MEIGDKKQHLNTGLNAPFVQPVNKVQPENKSVSAEIPQAASDHLFLNNIRPEQAREFLLHHITQKLLTSNNQNNASYNNQTQEISSAQETSDKLISAINQFRRSFADSSNSRLDELTTRIQQGFVEAHQSLQNISDGAV